MYFKGLTFIFSEDPPENHLKVIGGLLLKYYVLLLLFSLSSYIAVKVILSFCHPGPPRFALLPAAPRNCTCKFIQTPYKVEVES